VDALRELTDRERAAGKDVRVNPWSMRDDRLVLSPELRRAILDDVMPSS
jgi:hypothetical protein